MYYIRSIAVFLVLSLSAHVFAGSMQVSSNSGFSESQTISFQTLVDEGPGENKFVEVDKFFPGEPISYCGDELSYTFVPIFRNQEEAEHGKIVRLLFCYDGLYLDAEKDRLLESLSQKDNLVTGMASRKLRAEGHLFTAIENANPDRSLEDALIVDVGSVPNSSSYYYIWLAHGIGLCLSFLGVVWVCRTFKFPNTLATQIGMVILGIGGAAAGGWYRLTQTIDLSIPEEMIKAAAIETGTGIGIGCCLTAVFMIALKENFFNANPFGHTDFVVDAGALKIVKRNNVREIPISEIVSISLIYSRETEYVTGDMPSYRLALVANGKQIVAKGLLENGQGPEMQSQIDIVIENLANRYIEQILEGHVVAFDVWSIEGDVFSVEAADKSIKRISLSQITAVEMVDEKFRVWVAGNDKHQVQVSVRGTNSEVLRDILKYFIDLTQTKTQISNASGEPREPVLTSAQPEQISNLATSGFHSNLDETNGIGDTQAVNGLGRQIFEESQNHLNGYSVGGVSIVIGGAIGYFVNPLVGIAVGGVGLLIGVVSELTEGSGKKRFRIHESGVSLDHKGLSTELPYECVNSFAFQRTHIYCNGVYNGTRFEFEFVGETNSPEAPARIKISSATKTDQFDRMLQAATEHIGMKTAAQLADSGRIEWIPGSFICKDGIEVPVRSGLSNNVEKVAWDRIQSVDATAGKLLITIDDAKSASIKLDTSKPNFYPGFFLVEKLLEMHQVSLETTHLEFAT